MIAHVRTAALLFLIFAVLLAQGDRRAAISPDRWPERDGYLALDTGLGFRPSLPGEISSPGKP